MEELGDPRLIARTILDTTPGAAEGEYEEYHPFSSFAGNSGRSSQQENAQQTQSGGYSGSGNIHYYDLNKWYWKVLAVVIVILFFTGAYNHRRHSDAAHSAAAGDRHCGTGHVAGTRSARLKQQKMEL